MKGRSLAELLAGAAILLVAGSFLAYALVGAGQGLGLGAGGGTTLQARFDRIDGLAAGADVRVAGVKVGSVVSQRIDPRTYLAILSLRVDPGIRVPSDSSAEITSEGLLGGRYVALVPGGSDRMLTEGQEIEITQSAVSLESLLGRFIFSVTELASSTARQAGDAAAPPGPAPARP